jgi:hypothetical protein
MPEETVVAAPSAAEVEDVFRGEQPTLDEFNAYRKTGELPERFKPAEKAESDPADAQEETEESEAEEAETESESESEEAQEPPQKGSGAEKRIKQLLAKNKELESKLASISDVKPESSPAKVDVPATRTKPTAEDKDKDGNPKYQTYEDFVEDLADWKAEQRYEAVKREQQQQEAQRALQKQVEDARERYEDVDEVIFPAAQAINEAKIPQAVKEVFAQSDLFIDLCYVVGSDENELNKFIKLAQSNPRAAIGKVFEYERGIREELNGEKKAPEPKTTKAPKPPSPVGGASTRAFDVSDESLSPEEWMRKRNAEVSRRR